MYERLTLETGVEAVQQYRAGFSIQSTPDGLVFAPPEGDNPSYMSVAIPDRLRDFLIDLRLLRHIPIAYFVPDAALLPPESIRFFHVDPTWMDRVIEGVFSAANTGTVDTVYTASVLGMVRDAIDSDLAKLANDSVQGNGWTTDNGMTGMLIRSELVRRWPDLIVRGYKTIVDDKTTAPLAPVLRSEAISKEMYIVLFGGSPAMVHVREPNVGVRFGVEPTSAGSPTPWTVDKRAGDGTSIAGPKQPVSARNLQSRTLDIAKLALAVNGESRRVALHLEQRPYVQEFKQTVEEQKGSLPFTDFLNPDGTLKVVSMRKGRVMNLTSLQNRLAQVQQMYPKEKS